MTRPGLRCFVIICPCEILLAHSVSVQRRDRSLFFLSALFHQGPFLLVCSVLSFHCCLLSGFLLTIFPQCVCPKTWQLCSYSVPARSLLFSAAFFWFHSVSVQRRDRCSVSCFDLSLDPFCFPLLSSVFTVYLSKDVTGALLPTPLTPCLIPFPPPLLLFVLELLLLRTDWRDCFLSPPLFICWVLSPSATGLSVQRRGRYSPPFPINL